MPKLVRLKNGSEELDVAVDATMLHLRALENTDPIALTQLQGVCETDDPHGFPFFSGMREKLEGLRLLEDGVAHSTVRNIVLSAVVMDGPFPSVVDPIAES